MHNRQVALVTGANRGIGLQIAKELAARGFTVLVGSRDFGRGESAARTIVGDARALALDITNTKLIAAAAERIQGELGRLDVLVNNAAIHSTSELLPNEPLAESAKTGRLSVVSLAEFRAVFETNVFGVLAVTRAMLPLLREAPTGRIVNVSSSSGSLTGMSKPANPFRSLFGAYSASKTALNAMTLGFAMDLESTRVKVNAVCPGFTATDFTNFQGTRSVEEAAREPVRLALLGPDGPTGTFSNDEGHIPW